MTNGPVPDFEFGWGDSGDDTDGSLLTSSSIKPPPRGSERGARWPWPRLVNIERTMMPIGLIFF